MCCQCQNYNFQGRVKCNRCRKQKGTDDADGKPKHLIYGNKKTQERRGDRADKLPAATGAGDKQTKFENAVKEVNIHTKNQILDESPLKVSN